ncbi:hypothetical protein [Roseibium aggregatum]|uniref:CopL family metal-binding regulatory protein n=1 Tax=Roseibium aggregatum TaxID=187304 RepID=A0A926S8N4_9HYPH|nr:hypothetical protein [Roseibium aggregatum]MBD1549007.1 hypothetical protein [Roseibium aggregatum]
MRSLLTALLILAVAGIHSLAAQGPAFASPHALAIDAQQAGKPEQKIKPASGHSHEAMTCCKKSSGSKGPMDGSTCPMDCLGLVVTVPMPVLERSQTAEAHSIHRHHPVVLFGNDPPPIAV